MTLDQLKIGWGGRLGILCLGLVLLIAAGCAETLREVKTDKPTVDATALRPGLAVRYFEGFYRHVNQMPAGERALKEGKPGQPIPNLDHRFGSGPVFDSGLSRGVGVQMTGFIRLPSPGTYLFKAKANDGIRIYINQKLVIEDPIWHSGGDRFSNEAAVQVDSPGWYAFFLQYFQRKGTSMLELYWQIPGGTEYGIVPAEFFGHIP